MNIKSLFFTSSIVFTLLSSSPAALETGLRLGKFTSNEELILASAKQSTLVAFDLKLLGWKKFSLESGISSWFLTSSFLGEEYGLTNLFLPITLSYKMPINQKASFTIGGGFSKVLLIERYVTSEVYNGTGSLYFASFNYKLSSRLNWLLRYGVHQVTYKKLDNLVGDGEELSLGLRYNW